MSIDSRLQEGIEAALSRHLDATVKIQRQRAVEGGCINSAVEIVLSSGDRFLVKTNRSAPEDFFQREAEGLRCIGETESIRVPKPIMVGGGSGGEGADCPPFLILEFIDAAPARKNFAETLGRGLAGLHRRRADRFGFDTDNYIGSSAQPNPRTESWVDFFAKSRLGFQLDLLRSRGFATAELDAKVQTLIENLEKLIGGRDIEPSLLHGDLWAGNQMADESGGPVLIDPAVYYGDREADLAMTELFGRFGAKFYAAYREAYPLDSGYEDRRDIYNLYHLMNHLNLFGLSYMGGVMGILRQYT